MKTKKPATHVGDIHQGRPGRQYGHTTKRVQLVEHKATYEDAATGQRYSKKTGCVRPCNMWDTRMLDLDTVAAIDPGA